MNAYEPLQLFLHLSLNNAPLKGNTSQCVCAQLTLPLPFPAWGSITYSLRVIPKYLQVVKLDFQAPEGSIGTGESGKPYVVILFWLCCERPPHPAPSVDDPSLLYLDLSQPESQQSPALLGAVHLGSPCSLHTTEFSH